MDIKKIETKDLNLFTEVLLLPVSESNTYLKHSNIIKTRLSRILSKEILFTNWLMNSFKLDEVDIELSVSSDKMTRVEIKYDPVTMRYKVYIQLDTTQSMDTKRNLQKDLLSLDTLTSLSIKDKKKYLATYLESVDTKFLDSYKNQILINQLNLKAKSKIFDRIKNQEHKLADLDKRFLNESKELDKIHLELLNIKSMDTMIFDVLQTHNLIKDYDFNLETNEIIIKTDELVRINIHNDKTLESLRKRLTNNNQKILFDKAMDPTDNDVSVVVAGRRLKIKLDRFHSKDNIENCLRTTRIGKYRETLEHRHYGMSCFGSYRSDFRKFISNGDLTGFINLALVFMQSLNWSELQSIGVFARDNTGEGGYLYKDKVYTPYQIGRMAENSELDFLIKEAEEVTLTKIKVEEEPQEEDVPQEAQEDEVGF